MPENQFMLGLKDNAYFQSLPVFIQENIKQSGVTLNSENDLKRLAQNMLQSKTKGKN